jgi:hypothetical protein
VIQAVNRSVGDLGMFRPGQSAVLGAWWMGLTRPEAPKIIARLPFADRPDHPAGLPVFVIARPQRDGLARETILASLQIERWRKEAGALLAEQGAEVVASAGNAGGGNLLLSHPAEIRADALTDALEAAKCGPSRYLEVGCHASAFALSR